MTRIIVLGAGSHVGPDGAPPLWLAERHGKILVEQLVTSCAGLDARMVFAVRQEDVRRFHLDNVVARAAPSATVVTVFGDTQGAACTALLCIDYILSDEPLLILNANEVLDADYVQIVKSFQARNLDAGVVTFPSIHPYYSYVDLDEEDRIVEASEKNPISNHAVVGFFWFRRGEDFVGAVQDMIRKDARVDGKFFISLALNELVLKSKRLGVFKVDAIAYRPLKSSLQLQRYELDLELKAHR